MTEIVLQTVEAMRKQGTPFMRELIAGLIIAKSGPRLVEYN